MKKNKLLIILCCLFLLISIGCTITGFVRSRYKQNDQTNKSSDISDENKTLNNNEFIYSGTIGILFDNYNPYKDLKFESKVKSYYDGKIVSIADGKTIYQNLHATTTKRKLNTPDAKSAAIICNCGNCEELFYINTKNELHIIDIYNNEDKLYATDIVEMASIGEVNSFPDTCGVDIIAVKNRDGKIMIVDNFMEENKLIPIEEVEREFVTVDDNWNAILYIVSKNAKVDSYLTDMDGKIINAKAVVSFDDKVYVINEDNYIYEYNPWYKTKIPNIYSKIKVNSFKEENSNLVISYVDGSSEVLSGEIYIK